MPISDPHNSCLKCLGESHRKDMLYLQELSPLHPKGAGYPLGSLLMEAALRPALEPCTGSHAEYISFGAQCAAGTRLGPAALPLAGAKEVAEEADLFVRKVYRMASLHFRVSNHQALLGGYNFNLWDFLNKVTEALPQDHAQEFAELVSEGMAMVRGVLQMGCERTQLPGWSHRRWP